MNRKKIMTLVVAGAAAYFIMKYLRDNAAANTSGNTTGNTSQGNQPAAQ